MARKRYKPEEIVSLLNGVTCDAPVSMVRRLERQTGDASWLSAALSRIWATMNRMSISGFVHETAANGSP